MTQHRNLVLLAALGAVVFTAGLPPTARAQTAPLSVSQLPLFVASPVPPLNMLVMGKEHKNYYEAYNDASDLNGDGQLDVGYKPDVIDYFGYFNSRVCYNWSATNNRFEPAAAAGGNNRKQCSGQWSGDFLNYLTTSRMDALRKVLYGGFRAQDTETETTLQGAFLPQDAHSWGKEYRGRDIEGYDIALYAPLSEPSVGSQHLFAVTTTTGNSRTFAAGYEAPLFRVMPNSPFRVWNWLSIEGPVAGNSCFTLSNARTNCLGGGIPAHPGHPANRQEFTDRLEVPFATPANQFGGVVDRDRIDCSSNNCNPNGPDDDYLSIFVGTFRTASNGQGTYQFRVNGDDAFDVEIRLGGPTGTIVATAGCYGAGGFRTCGGGERTPEVTLAASTTYWYKFRHEEATGGDGYRFEIQKTARPNNQAEQTFPWQVLRTDGANTQNNIADTSNSPIQARFYNLRPPQPSRPRQDYRVRVQVCPGGPSAAALREDTCKQYPINNPNGVWKPTGLLHDFGETGRMYFGLITGSQRNNLEGGVLRRNIEDFAREVDPNTGQFRANVNGIARTLDRFRMIGGGYGGQAATFDNLANDVNWAWGSGTGNCPSIGGRPIDNGECRMWGNPIGEMMYESLRYFAGAGTPTTRFATTGGSDAGVGEETTMGLTTETWRDPYAPIANNGLGYPECAVPVQTVISDINPSYDSDLPGSPFTGAVTTVNNTPATIAGFNMATVGQQIWNLEFGAGARNVFIGDANNTADNAPTVKSVASLGNIRGLSPEEPTKQGSYSAASVARFGFRTDIHPATDQQNLRTFSVALSSPLPRIEVPIPGGRTVSLIPFGLTVSGTFGEDPRKPVNTIVDFYVEEIVNFPGQPFDVTVNGGRPFAVFRINYEDVEQGNDHDMDAIIRYQVQLNADNTVTVRLDSEYAAGSANQNLGYVISGTTRDGPYLEVRDRDSGQATSVYRLNTPDGIWAGGCDVATPPAACSTGLTFTNIRTFTPAAAGTVALQLKDPLWFAAKYGGFKDSNNNGDPDIVTEWDADLDGVPDNYFLVTNALNLREQLGRAFLAIERLAQPSGGINVSGVRVDAGSLSYIPRYTLGEWSGDLQAFRIRPDGSLGLNVWRASERLPAPSARNLVAAMTPGPATGVPLPPIAGATNLSTGLFTEGGLGANAATILGITPTELTVDYAGRSIGDIIAYLRGDGAYEADGNGTPGRPFRPRPSTKIGDIISSEPELFDPRADFGYSIVNPSITGSGTAYRDFLNVKKNATPTIFVGANAGILHAFDARDTAAGGTEIFGFIPNSALRNMGRLVNQNYVHQYYVDGSMRIGDAYLNSAWRSVLVGSVGAGGRSVYALDISNPSTFGTGNVLWEINETFDPDMGTAIGRPSIALLPGNRWVAIFGNGVNSATNRAMLFVVDLATGAILRKIDTGFGSASQANGMTSVVVTDVNRDGIADTVYGGDFQGNVWKFDLSSNVTTAWNSAYLSGATPRPLFVARDPVGVRQPITGSLNVSSGPLPGTQLVFFGTGSYFLVNDNVVPANPQIQSIYSIYDNGSPVADPTTGRTTALVQQRIVSQQGTGANQSRTTTTNSVDFTTRRGWFMDLAVQATEGGPYTALGERFLGRPLVSAGRVFFPTFRPTGGICRPAGENWLLGLNALSGANELSSVEIGTTGGTNPCVGGNCGGVFLIQGPPVKSLAVVIPQPGCIPGVDIGCPPVEPVCNPGDPVCNQAPLTPAQPTRCSLVVVPPSELVTGIVLPRPCGRVSWRQIQ